MYEPLEGGIEPAVLEELRRISIVFKRLQQIVEVVEGEASPDDHLHDPAAIGALAILARLSEFNTPTAKTAARTNLELEYIDLGTFN